MVRYMFPVHVELPNGNGEELHLLQHLYQRMQEMPAAKQMKLRCEAPVKVEEEGQTSKRLTPEEFEVESIAEAADDVSNYVKCPLCGGSESLDVTIPKIGDLVTAANRHIAERH
ncbi:hypothetical protein [Streptomyces atratus]|uniref:hypothetical protein n=1 Tax=Streptomyces atratus TaxID=1893 RepID=UPI00365336F6